MIKALGEEGKDMKQEISIKQQDQSVRSTGENAAVGTGCTGISCQERDGRQV